MEKLEIIVKGILTKLQNEDHNISDVGFYLTNSSDIGYEFNGFGKSGSAKLEYDPECDEVILLTRYDTVDIIHDVEDFFFVNERWCS